MTAQTISKYEPEIFHVIPDFSDALSTFIDKQAEEAVDVIGQVFLKHNTYEKYGLIMVHRHFPMANDEMLVETINFKKNISVAMPWKFRENSAQPTDLDYWNSFGLEMGKFVFPHTWTFGPTGSLEPFEFLTTDDLEEPPTPEFVSDLFEELKRLGLQDVFGLRRVRHTTSSYETTPEGVRANIVKYDEIPQGMDRTQFVKVVFQIDKYGRGRVGLWCVNCCKHCGTCNHCNSHKRF